MFKLNLPEAPLKFSNRNGKPTIWDFVRKKWLILTPEEYIRQSFLHYLMQHLHYPASLLSVERGLEVLRLSKRTDIVVYDNAGQPHILVECKAPQIKISKHALQQTSIYNLAVKAR
ncbi:MAG TPA: type I restriction endonuclease subunit R, partial [Cytophagales bacterium]|nr:type I restriction endonuclease subunit R [Cytophagales bacterium]